MLECLPIYPREMPANILCKKLGIKSMNSMSDVGFPICENDKTGAISFPSKKAKQRGYELLEELKEMDKMGWTMKMFRYM